uniref:Globin family profile domain-containing protein n=1 Tax=Romanomermis culicivorax TaxID=13658 RepID=A0A915JLR2_ROMCU
MNDARLQNDDVLETVDSRRKILVDYLSEKQRSQIACSWNTVWDQRTFAQDVYLHIFDQKPLLKSMFSFLNAETLKSDREFIRQTNLLADFLDEIVAQAAKNNEKSIIEMCRRLGAKHASTARMHFEPDWWRLFVHGILYAIKSHLNDRYSKRNSLNNV